MLRRSITVALAVAVLLLVAAGCGGGDDATAVSTQRESPSVVPPAPGVGTSEETVKEETTNSGEGRVINVLNHDLGGRGEYKFEPNEFTFKVGETVTFNVEAQTEFHTFTVDDLGIDVAVDAGETVTTTFTFDTAGEFKLICIPHELNGMTGAITVVQ